MTRQRIRYRAGQRLRVKTLLSSHTMTREDQVASERMLARLVALAYAADHSEQFGELESGPPATAAAEAGAPPASAGGPHTWSMEHGASHNEYRHGGPSEAGR